MKKITPILIFISLLFSINISPILSMDGTEGIKGVQKVYAEICGDYEFYYHERYIVLTVYVDKGSLMGVEPGDEPIKIEPVNLEELKFKAKEGEKQYFITFIRNNQGKVDHLVWVHRGEELKAVKRESTDLPLKFTSRELLEDFLQMKRNMENLHPALYEFTGKETFDRLFERQSSKLTRSMTVPEFYRTAAPLVARIGCGHSSLRTPGHFWGKAPKKLFPLGLRFLKGKAFVLEIYGGQCSIRPGSEIITINHRSVSAYVEKIKSIIPADGYNDSYRTYRLNQSFPFFYALLYGFPDEFTLVYKPPGKNDELHAVLKPVGPETISKTNKWESILDFDIVKEKSTAVLAMNNFYYYDKKETFYTFIDNAFEKIHQLGIRNLILDLRDNDGGDPFCTTHLLSYLASRPVAYFAEPYGKYARLAKPVPLAGKPFRGKLYILINGKCFSSTGHLCALLKYHNIGTFIGTETGGTYTCNDAKKIMHLKNTRFRLQIARGSFAVAVQGMPKNRGIIPDYPVEQTIEDLLKGRDTVKEFTMNLIEQEQKRN